MKYRLVIRMLGLLLMFLGGTMLLPLPFSFYYSDGSHGALIYSAIITIVFGALGFATSPKSRDIRPKEGFAIVALGWVCFSVFGSLPYLISGSIPSFTDAFFETISGFTTTGSTILTDIELLPKGILFWRSFTHWVGGMGIIVLTIAILPFLGVGGMQLFKAEVPGPVPDKLKPRLAETAKSLWGVYLIFSAAETILLMFGGMSFFDSLCHMFGTMATGGFSTYNASVGHFTSAYIHFVIMLFMFIAGANFTLHFGLFRGRIKDYWKSPEFRFYFGTIALATLLISADVYLNSPVERHSGLFAAFQDSLFQVLAIITTTGYGTADFELWSSSSHIVLLLLMFVGGMAGSTGGGMKVIRIMILLKVIRAEFLKQIHPRAVAPIKIGETTIDRTTAMSVVGFFLIYMFLFAAGSLLVSAVGSKPPNETLEMITSFSAVAACLNNIGPGLELVGPTDNYAFLSDAAKWILSFLMLAGRLEVFTVLILLAPSFWRK